jgi:hypothetical protein
MRSTNLVIFLVLLNVAAGLSGVMFPGALDVSMSGAAIDSADTALSNNTVSQPSADEITGSFLNNAGILQTISNIVFRGPNMLEALGMPAIFTDGFKLVLGFVVAFDIAEAVTGRRFS